MGTVRQGWEGPFLEDFVVGDIYRCRYGRTITEADNIQFTLLTNNTNHIDSTLTTEARPSGALLWLLPPTLTVTTGMGVSDQRKRICSAGQRSFSRIQCSLATLSIQNLKSSMCECRNRIPAEDL